MDIDEIWPRFESAFGNMRHRALDLDKLFDDEEHRIYGYGNSVSVRAPLEQVGNDIVPIIQIHSTDPNTIKTFFDNDGLTQLQLLQIALKKAHEEML